MEGKKQVRKRSLLKKGFQLRFMMVILVSMVLIAVVTGWSVYSAVIQTLYNEFHGEDRSLRLTFILKEIRTTKLTKSFNHEVHDEL